MVVVAKKPYPSRAETILVVGPAVRVLGVMEGCLDIDGRLEMDGRKDGCDETDGERVGDFVGTFDGSLSSVSVGKGVKEGNGVIVGSGVNVGNGVTVGKKVGSKVGNGQ